MVKHVDTVFDEYLLELFQTVWEAGKVPRDWTNPVLVAIQKKGDLNICDNWRGISVLDVVGKVFIHILKQRLQAVADTELAESQYGFHKEYGWMDMIFCARQLIENKVEHKEVLFFVFVDQKKAYDSAPQEAM